MSDMRKKVVAFLSDFIKVNAFAKLQIILSSNEMYYEYFILNNRFGHNIIKHEKYKFCVIFTQYNLIRHSPLWYWFRIMEKYRLHRINCRYMALITSSKLSRFVCECNCATNLSRKVYKPCFLVLQAYTYEVYFHSVRK